MITSSQIEFFKNNGYLIVEQLLNPTEIVYYRQVYENFLNGKIDTEGHRSDLSGAEKANKELITQIMRPSLLYKELLDAILHKKATQIAKQLLGRDMELDFDMLIDKLPHTNTPTPWHQDEAYWIDMPDKRAVSCWVALDDVVKENGCMWFVPTKAGQESLRNHQQKNTGGALECQCSETEAIAAEMKAGSCTFHHGRTLHYARGNSTERRRRAFITNFRPKTMIDYEREMGYDHLGQRLVR